MPTIVPNLNFLAPLVTEIWRGPKIKMFAANLLRRPLLDKFLHVAIVLANACQHTKLQLSSSISEGGGVPPPKKMGAPDFPRCPHADKVLYRVLVRVNAYKCATFQLPSSISYGDMEGVPK